MKKFLFTLVMAGSLLVQNIMAQTSVDITWAGDSISTYCPTPVWVDFIITGNANGYILGVDSIEVEVHFGDGNVGSTKVPIWQQNWFFANVQYTYTSAGAYTVQYIATGPDGSADTVVVPNEVVVGDTCGNISGQLYIDDNGNCVKDAGDQVLSGFLVSASTGGSIVRYATTNVNGEYWFNLPAGFTYDINIVNLHGLSIVCPASGTYTVSSLPSTGNDFATQCQSGFDLYPTLNGWGFRPGFNGTIWVKAKNARCVPTNGTLELVLDQDLSFVSSNPTPAAINGDTLVWNFSNVSIFNSFSAQVTVLTDTSAVINDTVCLEASVSPITGDAVPSNNTLNRCFQIRNSQDPNMKASFSEGEISKNSTVDYTIHFQNTGNAAAYNVQITDTVDSNLDINTFEVTAASHSMEYRLLEGNLVKFIFSNIMLPDSVSDEPNSHGFVSYKIDQMSNLPANTIIYNTANIFFDFNPAIVTNTTEHVIEEVVGIFAPGEAENIISIVPNPANTYIRLLFEDDMPVEEVIIMDVSGRVAKKYLNPDNGRQLHIGDLPSGIYLVISRSGERFFTSKLIKE